METRTGTIASNTHKHQLSNVDIHNASTTEISVIVPLYRCEPFIDELYERLAVTLAGISPNFEIIFVNDCGPMNDWQNVCRLAARDTRVKGINLSRNFGQHYAIYAGLCHAKGKWIAVMDGDLQDQPEEIPHLLAKCMGGFDICLARRVDRQDSFFKKLGSSLFYKCLAYLTGTEQNAEVANFGLYSRKVIDAVISMHDRIRYFPAMVKWVGFKRTELEVEHAARSTGKSSYSLSALLNLALNTILAFSDKPLRLTMKLGIFISAFSFAFAIYFFIMTLTGNIKVLGYSSLIISIWFLSGIIITLIGMIGLYIGRIFDQVKNRPIYIAAEKLNIE
jgi:polyisoprenyl-phosphate glycosyltransferase